MIHLYRNTTPTIYVTPSENSDVVYSYFYFKFTNRVTQDIIEINTPDQSLTSRVQEFVIEVNEIFDGYNSGLWTYEIKGSIDGQADGDVLESGYMYLHDATTFTPTEYTGQDNQFITYNGQ